MTTNTDHPLLPAFVEASRVATLALEHYGVETQRRKCIEELGEAIAELARGESVENLLGEFADVVLTTLAVVGDTRTNRPFKVASFFALYIPTTIAPGDGASLNALRVFSDAVFGVLSGYAFVGNARAVLIVILEYLDHVGMVDKFGETLRTKTEALALRMREQAE